MAKVTVSYLIENTVNIDLPIGKTLADISHWRVEYDILFLRFSDGLRTQYLLRSWEDNPTTWRFPVNRELEP